MSIPVVKIGGREHDSAPSGLDPALLPRARAGDPAAVGQLYALFHRRVRTFAWRLLGDAAGAEDLVQDTFVRLPGLIGRYRGDASFDIFLLAVVSRRARRHLRSAIRRRNLHSRFGTQAELTQGACSTCDADRRELASLLTRALDTLPREQRIVFVLRDVEGLSSAEAAKVEGIPEATVRTRLFHARRKLRIELAKLGWP